MKTLILTTSLFLCIAASARRERFQRQKSQPQRTIPPVDVVPTTPKVHEPLAEPATRVSAGATTEAQSGRVKHPTAPAKMESSSEQELTKEEFEAYGFGIGEGATPSRAERELLNAIRSVVYKTATGEERPHSTEGEMDPNLCEQARLMARWMAHYQTQFGPPHDRLHYGWDRGNWTGIVNGKAVTLPPRFRVLEKLGYNNVTEIIAETRTESIYNDPAMQRDVTAHAIGERKPFSKLTYEQKLKVHAYQCVKDWKGSPPHKATMDSERKQYCYTMARGLNGAFYCVGIVN